nr:hypothetical protein [uncultured Prevotella sp.]
MDLLKMMFSLLAGVLTLRTCGAKAPHMWCCWLAPMVRTAK